MIPVNTPQLDGNEAAYVAECIETGWISSEGPFRRQVRGCVCRARRPTFWHCLQQWFGSTGS